MFTPTQRIHVRDSNIHKRLKEKKTGVFVCACAALHGLSDVSWAFFVREIRNWLSMDYIRTCNNSLSLSIYECICRGSSRVICITFVLSSTLERMASISLQRRNSCTFVCMHTCPRSSCSDIKISESGFYHYHIFRCKEIVMTDDGNSFF